MKLHKILSVLLAFLIVLGAIRAVHTVQTNNQVLHLKEIKLRNVQAELNKLDSDYQKLQADHSKTVEQKNQEIKALQKKQADLERQISARRLLKAQEAKAYAATLRNVATQPVCGSNSYMAYIYRVESGCRTRAYNHLGCRGIGQSCPGRKLPCSDYDWPCQDAFFRSYAVTRYGSIYKAYLFRRSHDWW